MAVLLGALGLQASAKAPALVARKPASKDAYKFHEIDEDVMIHYRQNGYLKVDPAGDYSLALKAARTPQQIYWQMSHGERLASYRERVTKRIPEAEKLFGLKPALEIDYEDKMKSARELQLLVRARVRAEAAKSKLSAEDRALVEDKMLRGELDLTGRKNPIRMDGFVRALIQVINEERAVGVAPSFGDFHGWDGDFQSQYGAKFAPFTLSSKLLVALARGETHHYMVTGRERELLAWIIAQPKESVWPHELFRKSYRLHRGDVYLTLLGIENVLASQWLRPDREHFKTTRRLHPIINHIGMGADRFGAWYHLYGVMLYGYVRGSAFAKLMGGVEALGSWVLSDYQGDKQETSINIEGGRIGARLAKAIRDGSYAKQASNPALTRPEAYLDLSEDFSKRLEEAAALLKKGQKAGDGARNDSEVKQP